MHGTLKPSYEWCSHERKSPSIVHMITQLHVYKLAVTTLAVLMVAQAHQCRIVLNLGCQCSGVAAGGCTCTDSVQLPCRPDGTWCGRCSVHNGPVQQTMPVITRSIFPASPLKGGVVR
jgi:hypothetical protein